MSLQNDVRATVISLLLIFLIFHNSWSQRTQKKFGIEEDAVFVIICIIYDQALISVIPAGIILNTYFDIKIK